jgi:hypothetical protein
MSEKKAQGITAQKLPAHALSSSIKLYPNLLIGHDACLLHAPSDSSYPFCGRFSGDLGSLLSLSVAYTRSSVYEAHQHWHGPSCLVSSPLHHPLDHDHDRLGLPTPADTADLSTALLHLKQSLRFFHHASYPQSWCSRLLHDSPTNSRRSLCCPTHPADAPSPWRHRLLLVHGRLYTWR